jgi:hypothetical protein
MGARGKNRMSIFDELQQAASKRDPLSDVRARIQDLRDEAKSAFHAQFVLGSEDPVKAALLQGRLEALDECLRFFDPDDVEPQGSRKWADEE